MAPKKRVPFTFMRGIFSRPEINFSVSVEVIDREKYCNAHASM